MECGKATGMDDGSVEMVYKSCKAVSERLDSYVIHYMEKKKCLADLKKVKRTKNVYRNYKNASLLSFFGTVNLKIMRRVKTATVGLTTNEQIRFQNGTGCVNQICALRHTKDNVKTREVTIPVHIDSEKAYNSTENKVRRVCVRL